MKNTLIDLNNHLFEQLERLNDDELVGEDLEREINRASAMCNISSQIIGTAKIVVDAAKVQGESMRANCKLPDYLGIEDHND